MSTNTTVRYGQFQSRTPPLLAISIFLLPFLFLKAGPMRQLRVILAVAIVLARVHAQAAVSVEEEDQVAQKDSEVWRPPTHFHSAMYVRRQ